MRHLTPQASGSGGGDVSSLAREVLTCTSCPSWCWRMRDARPHALREPPPRRCRAWRVREAPQERKSTYRSIRRARARRASNKGTTRNLLGLATIDSSHGRYANSTCPSSWAGETPNRTTSSKARFRRSKRRSASRDGPAALVLKERCKLGKARYSETEELEHVPLSRVEVEHPIRAVAFAKDKVSAPAPPYM